MTPICNGCGRLPDQIPGVVEMAEEEEMTANEYIRQFEGTYNQENGHFLCDPCYIKAGQPSRPWPNRWVAP